MEKFNITFVQNQTAINADFLNWVKNTINQLVDRANGGSGGGSDDSGQSTGWQTYVNAVNSVQNDEYVATYVDANDKLIYGVRTDGTIYTADVSSSSTDQSYLGSDILSAISYMESNGRPQTSLN